MFTWYRSAGATPELARTIAVNTLIIGELFYLFNSRYIIERSLSFRGLRATPQVWAAVSAVLILQLPFTYLPVMQDLFGTEGLSLLDWSRMFALGAVVFLLVEAEKAIARKRAAR